MKIERGKLIVFEGVDASGKSTLCDGFVESLRETGQAVEQFHFPGKTPGTLGALVYDIHHWHMENYKIPHIQPESLQLLHIAAHVDTILNGVEPSLEGGKWVVLDRFWWSTWVYGVEANAHRGILNGMIETERIAWGEVQPDLVIHVRAPQPLRSDERDCVSWRQKASLYSEIAERYEGPVLELLNDPSVLTVSDAVTQITKKIHELSGLVQVHPEA